MHPPFVYGEQTMMMKYSSERLSSIPELQSKVPGEIDAKRACVCFFITYIHEYMNACHHVCCHASC